MAIEAWPDTLEQPALRDPRVARTTTPVSVVMPVLNEERHLEDAVRAVLEQEYDGDLELVLAIGPSQDRTAEIARELAAVDGRVQIVPNPDGRTPHALNRAIRASSHLYVIRVDAHGFLPPYYLRGVVRLLDETGAANVGGMMVVEGENPFGNAVARAMSSPLGIGGSKFHVGGEPGPAASTSISCGPRTGSSTTASARPARPCGSRRTSP